MKKLLRNTILIFLFPLLSFLFVTDVNAASISWIGASGDWETGANWSGGVVPGVDDDVLIDASVTVSINGTTTINSLVLGNVAETTTPTLNFDYNGVSVGALILDDGDFVVNDGAVITHTVGTSSIVGAIVIDVVTGDFVLDGDINIKGKGHPVDAGTGKGAAGAAQVGGGGGGYGGTGGYGQSTSSLRAGGVAYGSLTDPLFLGSGGGRSNGAPVAGTGGGLVRLSIGDTLYFNGSIDASGNNSQTDGGGFSGGGGSGGGVYLDTTVLNGSGTILVDGGSGGDGSTADGGGGSGGRVAIYFDTDNSSMSINAFGGNGPGNGGQGGAGTIFIKDKGLSYGDILVNNNNYTPSSVETQFGFDGYTPLSENIQFDNIQVTNKGVFVVNLGYEVSFSDIDFVGGTVVENGLINFASDLVIPENATYLLNVPKTYNSVVVNGVLGHSANTSSLVYKLDLTVTTNMTISSTGLVDVSSKGYSGDTGTGKGSPGMAGQGAGGGAHGGNGGNGETGISGGSAYGVSTAPDTIGSGGGRSGGWPPGGRGGGLAILDVNGILSVNGDILANGGNGTADGGGYSGGGGGGGGIYVDTLTLTGSGDIFANGGDGGNGTNADGGGGGGGLIALYYSNYSFTGDISYTGGLGPDSATDGSVGILYSYQSFIPSTTFVSSTNLLPIVEGTVVITYSDGNGSSDLDKLYLKLVNPLGDDIEYYADAGITASDLVPTVVSGGQYVEEITYNRTTDFPTSDDITITWHITTNWDWTNSTDIEVGAKSIDDGGLDGGYSTSSDADIIYTDSLNFSGTLGVLSTTKGSITTGTWVPTSDTLLWSGVKVVYDGTDVSPDDSFFNVQIVDNDDGLWTQELSSGSNISIQTTTDLTTDLSDEHTVSIADLPVGANDASSLSFIVKVDGTTPNIVSLTGNYNNTWQSVESSPTLSWTDPNSPSDDIFYITINGTEPSATNYAALTTNAYYTTSALGEGTKTVKVRPRSGVGVYGTTRTYTNKYDVTAPNKATNLVATPASTTSISLSWNNPSDTGSGFSKVVVMRSTSSFPATVSSGTKIYEGSNTSYTDSSLVASTTYYYSIFALDVLGNTSSSATVSVATQTPPPPPPPPVPPAVTPEPEPEEEVNVVEEETVSVEVVNGYIEKAEEFKKETITINTKIKDVEKSVEKNTNGGEEKPDIHVTEGESVTIAIPSEFFEDEDQELDRVLAYLNGEVYSLTIENNSYSTTFNAPGVSGSHILKLLAVYKSGDVKAANISVLVDPYGYVYYADRDGREVRVETQVYLYVVIDGERILWTGENNPLSTGTTGEFSFFVQPGTYVLVVDEDGFNPYDSGEFEVEGELVNINIQLEKDTLMDYLTTRNILITVGVLLTIFIGYGVAVASKKKV